MPKISIIIPSYNCEKYINQCIESIINQTLAETEIIVIDDASSDRTYETAAQYRGIILIKLPENRGPGVARNLGLKMARGNYISFVDADDWIEKDMLSKMYDVANRTNSDIVFCDYFNEYPDHTQKSNEKIFHKENPGKKDFILMGNLVANRIYKREFLVRNNLCFPDKKCFFEDLPIHVNSVLKAQKIGITRDALYHYRRRAGSISSNKFLYKGKMISDYTEMNRLIDFALAKENISAVIWRMITGAAGFLTIAGNMPELCNLMNFIKSVQHDFGRFYIITWIFLHTPIGSTSFVARIAYSIKKKIWYK